MKTGIKRVSVRYDRREAEWLMRCDSCVSASQTKGWWPLTLEFWDPRSGLQRCRACNATMKRLAHRQTVEERRAKQRSYYYAHRDERLAWRKTYHAEHHERINAERRERYAARKAAETATQNGLWDISGS